jgi:signal transduction histidine kinase
MPFDHWEKVADRLDRLLPRDVRTQFLRLAGERGRLEAIFNALREGVLVTDEANRFVTFANRAAARFLGLDAAGSMHLALASLAPGLDFTPLLPSPGEPGAQTAREVEIFRPVHRFLEVYASPLAEPAHGKRSGGTLLLLRDVSRERDDARELLESERLNAIVLLAAGVAHEIGNPLNSLGIHLQLLGREIAPLPEETRQPLEELLEVAKGEIARLDSILTQFLKALRPSAPACKALSLPQAVEETLETLAAEIADRGVAVEVVPPPKDLPDAWADAGQVAQAFYNVVHNALQAMGEGGKLTVSFETSPHRVSVTFADDGPGIPEETMGSLFEPFATTKKRGNGMGLVIVQRIMRDHGGNVVLESSPAGTRVTLAFQSEGPQMLLRGENAAP